MESMTSGELWSLVASIVSTILGVGAIALSVYFFVAGRRTETAVSSSLTKIETQAEMLEKLAGRQLDRLTRFVTAERPDPTVEITRLLLSVTELTKPLSATIPPSEEGANAEQLRAELLTCYIAIYYYAAVANFWSQGYLPSVGEFDDSNQFHTLTKRVVDMSAADFQYMEGILAACDQTRLGASPSAHFLTEAKDHWRTSVKSTADVFVAREKDAG